MVKIYFDMDGTVYDFYGCANWLEDLEAEKTTPYEIGSFLGDYDSFLSICRLLEREFGVEFGVITWLSRSGSKDFMERITTVKKQWCRENLPFVSDINVVPYGSPKQNYIKKKSKRMILLDDNESVCSSWTTRKARLAYRVDNGNVVEQLQLIYSQLRAGTL